MWYSFETMSDESLFGEESERQVATDLLLRSVEDCEELYREAAIEAISNKIYRQLLINGKDVLARKFAEKWGDYIEGTPQKINNKKLNLAWAKFRMRLAKEGRGGEYYYLKTAFEFRKPASEVMNLDVYYYLFEGGKREE